MEEHNDIEIKCGCCGQHIEYRPVESGGWRFDYCSAECKRDHIKNANTSVFLPKEFLPFHSESSEPVHTWFELSYAQYLTVPRSVLQSMPIEWQKRFVLCLEELGELIDWRPKEGRYWVQLKNDKGQYVEDEFMDYKKGGRRIPLKLEK